MKPSLELKLEQLLERYQEVSALLSDPKTIENTKLFQQLSKELAQLDPLTNNFEKYKSLKNNLCDLEILKDDSDVEISSLAQEDIINTNKELAALEEILYTYLIPKDENDDNNIYLEIRAGTGGDEAAIFVGDLFRMYTRYAETQNWQVEIINAHHSEHGGFKEVVLKISGHMVYAKLKFESGTHRVQRVPITEAQGRVHTSACTVAILPEVSEVDAIQINSDDLRIDTYRASGAGGQHVNKTDSAIRITHIPTGTVVECQDERSQHKNRAKAMSLLQTKLLDAEKNKQREDRALTRKLQVGSGDRSERIRTYNFPQGRLTDHRINLTLYQLNSIIEGDLEPVTSALTREYQADLLAELNLDNE